MNVSKYCVDPLSGAGGSGIGFILKLIPLRATARVLLFL